MFKARNSMQKINMLIYYMPACMSTTEPNFKIFTNNNSTISLKFELHLLLSDTSAKFSITVRIIFCLYITHNWDWPYAQPTDCKILVGNVHIPFNSIYCINILKQ